MQYVNVSGSVDKELCKDNSEIIVLVKDNNGGQRAFEAFTTSNDDTDYGYQAYIPTEYMNPDSVDVSIVIKTAVNILKLQQKQQIFSKPIFNMILYRRD